MSVFKRNANTPSTRLTEKWFRRGLWLVALVFAIFLIGLGGKIIGDLQQAEAYRPLESYMAQQGAQPLLDEGSRLAEQAEAITIDLAQAELDWEKQREQTRAEQQSLNNWLAARSATEQSAQNPEVLERTRRLDELKRKEIDLQRRVSEQRQKKLNNEKATDANNAKIKDAESAAGAVKEQDDRRIELNVFLYRLALTLPLLLAAGYLFKKKRRSKWWPFVWGFIYFALFAFFVELVPYLPSYGGYVRYAVGLIITALVGRYAIVAMNRYLERKRQEEVRPASERGNSLDYDHAQRCLGKGICPGCERPLDFKQPEMDYCPHCGIGLFKRCRECATRINTFSRYCCHCGTAGEEAESRQG
ncbi:MAG: serine endopeptidase [Neisseria sp.]|nr:serine endopeptidase [Neisseria sp.]